MLDFLINVMFNKLECSVSLNLFIVLEYARNKFHAVGGMMSCFRNPSNMFSFISIHRDRWYSTSIPKDKNTPRFDASESDQYMLSIGQYFDSWHVIGAFEYPCRLHIVLVIPCVSIHVFTSNASLLQYSIRMTFLFYISILISLYLDLSKIEFLGSFWVFMIEGASSCWIYAPPALALAVGQYAVIIMFLILFFPWSNIYYQRPRLMNSWPVEIALHDTFSTVMIVVPPLWNGSPEMMTQLYPVLIFLVLNHPYVLLYIFSFMGILIQLLFNSVSPIIDITSLIIFFFKVSIFCLFDWYDALPIPTMFWDTILILPSLPPPLSLWP